MESEYTCHVSSDVLFRRPNARIFYNCNCLGPISLGARVQQFQSNSVKNIAEIRTHTMVIQRIFIAGYGLVVGELLQFSLVRHKLQYNTQIGHIPVS